MRDPHLVCAHLLVPQLTAENAGRRQLRRGPGFDQTIRPRDKGVAKQIAGFPGCAYKIRHIVPRIFVTACSPSLVAASFHFAASAIYALAHISEEILAVAACRRAAAPRPCDIEFSPGARRGFRIGLIPG
ncbi:MAG: hypothetical protein A3H27_02040 [Acidobacteria bacterium RIFCSPLOWO2_02_FULL_59_13]|nr:MAG: hypothetical protein A3H27_02040 [Acidobacteria bacterium RIFCSPLOWO2_02_FULL_59_13]